MPLTIYITKVSNDLDILEIKNVLNVSVNEFVKEVNVIEEVIK